MICSKCKKTFRNRSNYIVHLTTSCTGFNINNNESALESEEQSDVDDSDSDPLWSREENNDYTSNDSFSDVEPQSSPVTAEQINVSAQAIQFLDNRPLSQMEISDVSSKEKQDSDLRNVEEMESGIDSSTSNKQHILDTDNNCFIAKSAKTNGKRKWNRKDSCIFCEELVTNFTRHLTRRHAAELEVAKILAKPKGSKDRKLMYDKLRKKGNYFHNNKCIRDNSGSVIVVQRPQSEAEVPKYLPCKNCFGFFSRTRLYRHMRECISSKTDHSSKHAQSVGSTLLMVNEGCSEELKLQVLQMMKNDPVSAAVRGDKLICEFGSRMLKKHHEQHFRSVVSQKLRELGRLLLCLNAKNQSKLELSEFLKPENYEKVISSIKEVAGYNKESGSYKTPSIATKLGHSLRACAEILECRGIITSDSSLKESAKQFNFIMSKQWQFDISSNAIKTLEEAKLNKPHLLPLAEDIKLLHEYIVNKEKELATAVKVSLTETLWRELSEITLVHIILFNRRRAGEAERIKVSQYTNRNKTGHRSEVTNALSETERTLCNSLTRFEIRGKRGRGVPVLLTPLMKSNFDLLIETRSTVGVNDGNPFMFAIPNTVHSCMRGSAVVKKHANLCGAKQCSQLTSTDLRKHVATMSQLLNLSQNDIEQLAKYMGHDLSIHKEYYRLPENTWQMAKVSKLLLLMEKGKVGNLDNPTLDNINFEEPVSEENSCDDDDEGDDIAIVSNPIDNGMCTAATEICRPTTESKEEETEGRQRKRRRTCVKKPWTEDEKTAVMRHFQKHVLLKKVPNKLECSTCLMKEPVLSGRSWSHIKFFVKNNFRK